MQEELRKGISSRHSGAGQGEPTGLRQRLRLLDAKMKGWRHSQMGPADVSCQRWHHADEAQAEPVRQAGATCACASLCCGPGPRCLCNSGGSRLAQLLGVALAGVLQAAQDTMALALSLMASVMASRRRWAIFCMRMA